MGFILILCAILIVSIIIFILNTDGNDLKEAILSTIAIVLSMIFATAILASAATIYNIHRDVNDIYCEMVLEKTQIEQQLESINFEITNKESMNIYTKALDYNDKVRKYKKRHDSFMFNIFIPKRLTELKYIKLNNKQ